MPFPMYILCGIIYMPLTHNIGQSRPPISVSQVMPYESKEDISLMYVDNACTKDQILCKCPYSKLQ